MQITDRLTALEAFYIYCVAIAQKVYCPNPPRVFISAARVAETYNFKSQGKDHKTAEQLEAKLTAIVKMLNDEGQPLLESAGDGDKYATTFSLTAKGWDSWAQLCDRAKPYIDAEVSNRVMTASSPLPDGYGSRLAALLFALGMATKDAIPPKTATAAQIADMFNSLSPRTAAIGMSAEAVNEVLYATWSVYNIYDNLINCLDRPEGRLYHLTPKGWTYWADLKERAKRAKQYLYEKPDLAVAHEPVATVAEVRDMLQTPDDPEKTPEEIKQEELARVAEQHAADLKTFDYEQGLAKRLELEGMLKNLDSLPADFPERDGIIKKVTNATSAALSLLPQPPERLERLKSNWYHDPCYDLEDALDFAYHKAELLAYRQETEKKWVEASAAKLKAAVDAVKGNYPNLTDAEAERLNALDSSRDNLKERARKIVAHLFKNAGVSYQDDHADIDEFIEALARLASSDAEANMLEGKGR